LDSCQQLLIHYKQSVTESLIRWTGRNKLFCPNSLFLSAHTRHFSQKLLVFCIFFIENHNISCAKQQFASAYYLSISSSFYIYNRRELPSGIMFLRIKFDKQDDLVPLYRNLFSCFIDKFILPFHRYK